MPVPIPTTPLKVYDTPEGFSLVRKILAQTLPLEPHDYKVEGICAVLNGRDLMASGKTGFFIMLTLVVRAIANDKTLALGGKSFSIDLAMIVVCPTKALQADMVSDTGFHWVPVKLFTKMDVW